MPLLDFSNTPTERVTIDGDWYDIRAVLSAPQVNKALDIDRQYIGAMEALGKNFTDENQDRANAELVNRLIFWLLAWSHSEEKTAENLLRIPNHHLAAIQEMMKRVFNRMIGREDPN